MAKSRPKPKPTPTPTPKSKPKSQSNRSRRIVQGARPRTAAPQAQPAFKLRLYVAGESPKSVRAISNLKRLCEEHLEGRYHLEVIDLLEHPHLARGAQIVAIPTLVINLPEPVRKVIGDMSNTDRVLVGLALQQVV